MDDAADRPRTWAEYVGQPKLKSRLETYIEAAVSAKTRLDHTLLWGPPGVGKTALGRLIAERMKVPFMSAVMPARLDLIKAYCRQPQPTIVFLDELHRASDRLQEEFLTVLEDGYFQVPNGRLPCPNATIIGATTEPESIIPPLYDRFEFKPLFEPYSQPDMEQMVQGMATRMKVPVAKAIIPGLASAANGIPRNARQLVVAARALSRTQKTYTIQDVLDLTGLTVDGLGEQHIEYLRVLDRLGGRAGLSTMVTILRLHPKVVNELERTLVAKNMISFRSTGRELSSDGWQLVANP